VSELIAKIEQSIAGVISELGYRIVRIMFIKKAKGKKTLQLMIERKDGNPCDISGCEQVSKAVSVSLDVMDCIPGSYDLEVSSAGIDRPLVKSEDFVRFCGNPVVIRTYTNKIERQLFKGILESATDDGIKVVLDTPLLDGMLAISLAYDEISSACLDGEKLLKMNKKGACRR
jgi:ribosome maturation factor RimP